MLIIYLRWDQLELVPQLRILFPELALVMIEGVIHTYQASLQPGMRGAQQYRFLKTQQIAFIDFEQRREAIIRGFFQGVELEGDPIRSLQFRRVLNTATTHSATLSTENNAVCLRFPSHWNSPYMELRSSYDGWLYVGQEASLLRAAIIGACGAIEQLLYQTPQAEDMETWLKEQRYTRVIATSASCQLVGLYRPQHGPEAAGQSG